MKYKKGVRINLRGLENKEFKVIADLYGLQ